MTAPPVDDDGHGSGHRSRTVSDTETIRLMAEAMWEVHRRTSAATRLPWAETTEAQRAHWRRLASVAWAICELGAHVVDGDRQL